MTKRIQFKRVKGWRKPHNCIMVCRPSRFGNPFNWQDIAVQPGYESQKELAAIEFKRWLNGESPYNAAYPERRQWILDNLDKIRNADYVACYCRPDESCHGDVLIELANERT